MPLVKAKSSCVNYLPMEGMDVRFVTLSIHFHLPYYYVQSSPFEHITSHLNIGHKLKQNNFVFNGVPDKYLDEFNTPIRLDQ